MRVADRIPYGKRWLLLPGTSASIPPDHAPEQARAGFFLDQTSRGALY